MQASAVYTRIVALRAGLRERLAARHPARPWFARLDRARIGELWREYGIAALVYAVLTVALSWPTARDFGSRLTSSGVDARHNLWIFWHTLQALLGRQPLFDAPFLYYPRGISLLVHGVGPLTGLFALPFWAWGPAAAYNGALLVSLWLSGYCAYRLARGLDLGRDVALFAGVLVLASPMCLAGLNNHVTKVFVGALALLLLALHHALDLRRSAWWAPLTGAALLLVLLHNGYQFVFGGLAIGMFALFAVLAAPRAERWPMLRRVALVGLGCLALAGPLLLATERAAQNPAIVVDVNQDSFAAPDLLQYLLPPHESRLFGAASDAILTRYSPDTKLNSETAVSLALVALPLCVLAARARRPARRWLVLAASCVVFSLGPSLRLAGRATFTEYDLPIILPYAFLTGLPGLDFMRAPGRFMMLGFVAFAIAAAFGLGWLVERFPRWRRAIVPAAIALALLETWPRPFPQETLPATPAFYQRIAQDAEQYGVFDLPLRQAGGFSWNWPTIYASSYYQIFQMTHHKGIASGYISRSYGQHPVFADVMTDRVAGLRIDGRPAVYANFLADLAANDYRYVVLHKTLFDTPKGAKQSPAEQAQALLDGTFGGQAPVADDDLVRVYQVRPDPAALQIRWGDGWRLEADDLTWATSPATLAITSPEARQVVLQLTPALIHDAGAKNGLGAQGMLTVQVGDQPPVALPIAVDRPASLPLALPAGAATVKLELQAGNFKPSDYGSKDTRVLSFAVRAIDLRTRGL